MSEAVTIERLERGLELCAYLVGLDGPVAVPQFENLERELTAARRTQDTLDRAKRLLKFCRDGELVVSTSPTVVFTELSVNKSWADVMLPPDGERHPRLIK